EPPAGKPTVADQAWAAVVAYVTAAPAGARLPPERAFAERLGVSRSTLRAAISRLEVLGLVEVRHGSGIVVRRPDPSRTLELVLSAVGDDAEVAAQALDLRTVIEPQLAAAAARHRRPLSPAPVDERGFHTDVAAASGNALAGALVAALVGLSGDAVGDVGSARDAMSLHLRSLRRAAARSDRACVSPEWPSARPAPDHVGAPPDAADAVGRLGDALQGALGAFGADPQQLPDRVGAHDRWRAGTVQVLADEGDVGLEAAGGGAGARPRGGLGSEVLAAEVGVVDQHRAARRRFRRRTGLRRLGPARLAPAVVLVAETGRVGERQRPLLRPAGHLRGAA